MVAVRVEEVNEVVALELLVVEVVVAVEFVIVVVERVDEVLLGITVVEEVIVVVGDAEVEVVEVVDGAMVAEALVDSDEGVVEIVDVDVIVEEVRVLDVVELEVDELLGIPFHSVVPLDKAGRPLPIIKLLLFRMLFCNWPSTPHEPPYETDVRTGVQTPARLTFIALEKPTVGKLKGPEV